MSTLKSNYVHSSYVQSMTICMHIKHIKSTTMLMIMACLIMAVAQLFDKIGWLQKTLYFVMEFRRGDVTVNKYLLVLEFGFGVVS